ncbi:MAG: TonB family protein [Sphingomonadales bacterium]|nr:TonB family protein [Sphingomonadales bacterium]MBD3774452.1 TonB family protein [Paracoccaceae bacterium]
MAYAEPYGSRRGLKGNPGAIAGVIVIHAALGVVLVTGLSTKFVPMIETGPMPTTEYKDPLPPPPPEPQPKQQQQPDQTIDQKIVTPLPPIDVSPRDPIMETTPVIPKTIPDIIPKVVPLPMPSTTPGRATFDPVAAAPRNDPANWVTQSDYRSRWINEDMAGTTSFRVEVGTDGRVQSCTITKSSGHAALDQATCDLVTRRAKFKPAKNQFGELSSGTYASSVRWQIPD